ncbi:hypothetical protein [Sporosarcina sp. P12(2017)]|nr:hypothetical protein [Sporosarcina sp. P12(2017)]
MGALLLRRGSMGMALFTGVFVLIVMLFIEYLIPNINALIKIIVVGLSAMIGGMIGNKLFPNKQ